MNRFTVGASNLGDEIHVWFVWDTLLRRIVSRLFYFEEPAVELAALRNRLEGSETHA